MFTSDNATCGEDSISCVTISLQMSNILIFPFRVSSDLCASLSKHTLWACNARRLNIFRSRFKPSHNCDYFTVATRHYLRPFPKLQPQVYVFAKDLALRSRSTSQSLWGFTFESDLFHSYSKCELRSTKTSEQIYVIPNLKTMKLSSAEFQSMFTPELQILIQMFNKHGFELRIAGGAVRDLINGIVPNDIDFATTATPTEMKDMFNKEEIRMINANGEAHGTITARVNDKENFEITTLRIDVVTDGRRAQVEFTRDWMLDANRRDLTINSMFLGPDGTVYDYFNGMEDLKAKRIHFVGDPEHRIQEDYLRILRYFRFYGRIADSPDAHDEATTNAIKANAEGLHRVSGERIWMEMKKILVGKMAASLLEKMISLGLGPPVGLPNAQNFQELRTVCDTTEGLPLNPVTRLSSVLENEADVYEFHKRNKVSNDELSLALFIVNHRHDDMGDDLIRYCTDLHTDTAGKESKVMSKIVELMRYRGHIEVANKFPDIQLPQFHVSGSDLIKHEVPRGPKFASTLNELRQIWKRSNYSLTKEELCLRIPEVLEKLPTNLKKMRTK